MDTNRNILFREINIPNIQIATNSKEKNVAASCANLLNVEQHMNLMESATINEINKPNEGVTKGAAAALASADH